MKTILFVTLLLAGVFSASAFYQFTDEEYQNLWAQWKQQYQKQYQGEEHEQLRYQIFVANYKAIQQWNSEGNTAILAMNKFGDLTNAEFGAFYANSFAAPNEIAQANLQVFEEDEATLPSDWDWRSQGAVTPIKNQEQCGSCWTFATVATAEALYFLNGNQLTSFSEQQIVDCDKGGDGCSGGWPYQAMAYVANNGLETESAYPYAGVNQECQYSSSQAIQTGVTGAAFVTPKNVNALKTAIYQQPVAVIVEADQNAFQFYSSGVITTGCGVELDHAITAVGYGSYSGQDAFIVKNSWGTDWGVEGYVYISTSTQYNDGLGACGILSQPQYPKGLKVTISA